MADDHDIHAHRFDVLGSVDEGLALAQAGSIRGEVDRIGRETLGGEAEAGFSAGTGFEEEIDDCFALEHWNDLAFTLVDFSKAGSGVENQFYLDGFEFFEGNEMLANPGHFRFRVDRGLARAGCSRIIHCGHGLPRRLMGYSLA